MWCLVATPFIAAAAAQLLKAALAKPDSQRTRWESLWSWSGMPSMHAAFTVSLAVAIYLAEGPNSSFAVAAVVAALAIIDALALRRTVGQHGQVLNQLVDQLPAESEYRYPILGVRVGHTVFEILGGAALGAAVALLVWWL